MEYKKIGFDLHVGGPHQLYKMWDRRLFKLDGFGGDICDFTNVKHDEVDELLKFHNKLVDVYGDWYVKGNHEQSHWKPFCKCSVSQNGLVWGLAHHVVWSDDKIEDWRMKEDGAGFLRRSASCALNRYRDRFGGFSITDEEKERAFRFMDKNGLQLLCVGHKHPLELKVFTHNNKELRFYPRGIHTVAID